MALDCGGENSDYLRYKYHLCRKLGLTHWDIDTFLDNMCRLSSFQKIYYLWRPFLTDPKDDHVLETDRLNHAAP